MGTVKTAFSHGTMQLNSLIPAACLLVSACQSLGLQGLKEQKTREGKKQVRLPCKTIVEEECSEKEVPRVEEVCEWYNEECKTEYVKHCENSRREKRGVLQASCSPPPSPPRTRRPLRPPPGFAATTRPRPPVGTTTIIPSMANVAQPTIVTATGRAAAEVPLSLKTALKFHQSVAA